MTFIKNPRKSSFVQLAREEGLQNLKGNSQKAGPEIEKFLNPFRERFAIRDKKYLNMDFGFDWCAAFVYYLMLRAGYDLDITPFDDKRGTFGLVGIWFEWGLVEQKFKDRSYVPEPGDLILFDRLLSESELDHIGIVLENHNQYLLTAEGNVENMTGIFKRHKDNTLRGYINI